MPSDFSISWELSHGRFEQEVQGLTQEQLNFRLYEGALTIGEMALHVCGTEIWFISQINGVPVPDHLAKIVNCASDSIVNDNPFPFTAAEITPELVSSTFNEASNLVKAVIFQPTESQLAAVVQTVLGPVVDGRAALARIAFHGGYHHGQTYQIKQSPDFP